MGKNGANTEGYITEISKDFEDCKMWDFDWTDMQVLMVINSLNSSDENEACLAEKLTESILSILNKKVLEMPQIHKIISDLWGEIKERRQVMSSSGKGKRKGKDTVKEKRIREGEKENKMRTKESTRKREHMSILEGKKEYG